MTALKSLIQFKINQFHLQAWLLEQGDDSTLLMEIKHLLSSRQKLFCHKQNMVSYRRTYCTRHD